MFFEWLLRFPIIVVAIVAGFAVQLGTSPVVAATIDVQDRSLEWIEPGTVVEKGPPEGWSHLIYVSWPRVASGDVAEVSESVKRHARLFTVAVIANVLRESDGSYRFDKVAIGIGTSIQKKNTIINSARQEELGANLGLIGRQVLATSEKNFEKGNTQVVRTSSMIVFDSKVMLLVDGEHREMISRNALLLSREQGSVGMLRWMFDLDEEGNYSLVDEPAHFVRPGFQEDQVLNVKADEFFLGIPGKKAIAQVKMFEGDRLKFPPALEQLAALRRYTTNSAAGLERELWKLWEPAPTAAEAE